MKIGFLLFSLALTSTSINAQNELLLTPELVSKKNAVYCSIGGVLFYTSGSLFYERIIKEKIKEKNINVFVRGGYGMTAATEKDGTGRFVLLESGVVTGESKSHFEGALGINVFRHDFSETISIYPAGSVGYRYQKPDGGFIFRTGIGYPEAVFIGIGFSF
jgi:hypothetical protein